MKSRVSRLAPEMEKAVRDSIDQQMRLERGYITEAVIKLTMYVLASPPYGWGKKRLHEYWERVDAAVKELLDGYGNDCWIDKVESDLARIGVTFEDDGWIAERQAHIDLAKAAPVLPSQNPQGFVCDHQKALEELKRIVGK